MTFNGWLQIALYCAVIVLLVKPFGGYMTRVFTGERTFLSPVLGPLERGLLPAERRRREERPELGRPMPSSMLLFSLVGFASLYALMRFQAMLPFNPAGQSAVEEGLAFNTAMSFDTNTNWQSYVPETTMSYLVQMAGLTVHNFVSAATGIALAVALVRGFARRSAKGIGNFWVDLTRCTLYILLPISIVVGLFFVWQGMPQNLGAYTEATTLEGAKQVIAQGPVASQEVIKMLGTNGGGFFNANSAHPFENPNAITNFVQIVLIFSIGAGAHQRVRPHGRRSAPGLGGVRGHGHPVPGRRRRRPIGPRRRAIPPLPRSASTASPRRCRRAATWRARRSASASPIPPCSPPSPPTPRAAPSTPCTTASRRSAAWCRCSTSSWARSSSAASAPASTACCCSPSSRCSSPA